MNNDLKFTGTFKNLKNSGYTFMKLYANNYKVYNNDDYSNKIWVWVARGGTIELDDLYNCSKLYIEAIKSINWDAVEERISGGSKYVNFYYKHCEPNKGFEIKKFGFDFYVFKMYHKKMEELKIPDSPLNTEIYDECYTKVRETFDSSKYIGEESSKELLKHIEKIQNS